MNPGRRNLRAMLAALCTAFLLFPTVLFAGDTLRIAFYNALAFPGTDGNSRAPYFRTIFAAMKPDVLVTGEMQSQEGVDILRNALNAYEPGAWASVPFHHGIDTDNALFYRVASAKLDAAAYISTDLRDIAEYKLTVFSSGERINLYAVHLKAGSTSSDQAQRLNEATTLRNYMNNLAPGTKFMVLGDFNVYTSTEECYQKLTGSETNNNGRVKDPINRPGSWHNNSSFSSILTQSPRIASFDGGTGGGMDDRFDFILTSYSLDSNVVVSRYAAYGNDGSHYNDSINHLPNHAVPDSVANALYRAADHLPVMCDFLFKAPHYDTVSVAVHANRRWNLLSLPVGLADARVAAMYPSASPTAYIYDTTGYYPIDFFDPGSGYWVKFPADTTVLFTGRSVGSRTVSLYRGWNVVGGISDSAAVADVTFDPPDLDHSGFFGYDSGYVQSDSLIPGKGYWIKAGAAGTVTIRK